MRPVKKRSGIGVVAATLAATAVAAYCSHALIQWIGFGRRRATRPGEESDPLLDAFLPEFDVVERHHTVIHAPADVTLAAARDTDLMDSRIIRTIFSAREILLGARPDAAAVAAQPHGLIARALAQGWGVLAEIPGREIVMGAVTQPWEANVSFRALMPEAFAAFRDPGFVKIVWSLRADPAAADKTIFQTETRALACGPIARAKFRRYWALLSPGIILIRLAVLGPLKREAERRAALAPA